jgi:threonine dehydrogenase-like Zn-dependent dehydrogenase
MDPLYGDRTAGIFGYTHLTGGFSGGQAEYARVPFADVNCLPVPDDVPDEKALFLSDIICTGYQAAMIMGEMKQGDVVAVWGCGPVGLMSMSWSKFHGASRIIAIDNDPYRLALAREHLGAEIINFDETKDVVQALKKMVPRGPDVTIDAAGFRFAKSWGHKLQRTVKLEQDSVDILDECIRSVRKGGHVSMIADYFTTTNQFPTGAIQLKAITIAGGQVHVPRYWHTLLEHIRKGEFDPTFIITHRLHFERIVDAYKMFAYHENNCVKTVLHTSFYYELHRT